MGRVTGILVLALAVTCFSFSAWAGKPGGGGSQWTLSIAVVGSGTTNPAPGNHLYNNRTNVTVTAIADAGWSFDHWEGSVTGTNNPVTFKITSNMSITAVFVQAGPTTYTLTTSVQGGGSVSPAGVTTHNANDVVTVTATPDAGWDFDHWEGALSGSTNPTTVTMDANKSVTAVFTQPSTWPNSMAVIGDSISRAALADDSIDEDQPENSWSTGQNIVNSHYNQIKANNAGITGNNFNNAVNGSRADDLLGQSNITVSQGVDYVTIEMGGNDLCRDSVSQVTPLATWEFYWNEALDVLQAGLPDATILVCSTVRVNRVWEVGSGDFWCRYILWPTFSFCDSVLNSNSTDRAIVAQFNIDYNTILANLCSQKGIFFEPAVYSTNFNRGDLSDVDCFHPAVSAQEMLGAGSYDPSRF